MDRNVFSFHYTLGSCIWQFTLMPDSTQPTSNIIEECGETIPDWLTKSYFENKLRNYHNDPLLKVSSFDCQLAIGKGENYGGILTRVKVQYKCSGGGGDRESRNESFIVKSNYEGDALALEKQKPYDIFNREMSIYQEVLPKLVALMREIKDNDQMFAKTIAIDYDRSVLIFEDLAQRNFVMPDRTKGLDMDHVKLILCKLAKMHATSAVLNEREPNSLVHYDRGFYNHHTDVYSPLFVGNLEACGRCVSRWPEYQQYGQKLLALTSKLMALGKRVFDPDKHHVNVLAHGDLWLNNVMFQYDNGTKQPIDVIILDFQYSAWGSPAIDLHYLFNTSLQEEIRLHRQDELIQFYFYIFANTLRAMNFQIIPIPSLHQFHIQMEEKRFYAFTSACIVQPIMLNEETDDADFNALMGEDERAKNFKKTLYKNPKVQQKLKQLLPIFDRRGLLDLNQ